MLLLTTKIEEKFTSLGIRCRKPRLLEKKDKPEIKEVLAKSAIKAKIKKVLARVSTRPRPSKTRNKPQEW